MAKNEKDLSPEARKALGEISGEDVESAQENICLECGALDDRMAVFCSQCGSNLSYVWGPITDGYLTALDLLRSGELDQNQVRELLDNLVLVQSFYTAGTRYSVFG